MKRIIPTLAAMVISGSLAYATPVKAAEDVVIVYDASGSMWGQIDGVSKIEIAREVMADLINQWDEDTNLGLVAYGHRRKGDCSDIETLIKPSPLNKASFIKTVNGIMPVGKTPISASLQHAADLLSYRDSQATIVLISDGLETCNADPCETSKQLAAQGVKLTAHVVGFDLETKAHANLSCIADNTGGIFVPASNAAELHDALAQVQSAMQQQPAAPVVKPEPEKPALPEVEINGPEQVTTGAMFDVSWSTTIDGADMVAIVPADAKEGTRGNYKRTGKSTQAHLTAPADTGLYELRYILNEGSKTLATTPIEVTEAEVSISAPSIIRAENEVAITWSSTIHPSDMINIVPAGADEGVRNIYLRAGSKTEGRLTAPKETGLYEIRYMLNEGKKTIASAPLEVVAADAPLDDGAGLSVPTEAQVGEEITVSWSGTSNSTDQRVSVARTDQPDFSWITVQAVGDQKSMNLTMPDKAGFYEVRFLDIKGRKLLGRSVIEVK